jgi:hypothetical protein
MRARASCSSAFTGDVYREHTTLADDVGEAERRFQLAPLNNGMSHTEGLLDKLTGANLHAALEAAMPKPCHGDNPHDHPKPHDALSDIALESLANAGRSEVGGETGGRSSTRPRLSFSRDAVAPYAGPILTSDSAPTRIAVLSPRTSRQ